MPGDELCYVCGVHVFAALVQHERIILKRHHFTRIDSDGLFGCHHWFSADPRGNGGLPVQHIEIVFVNVSVTKDGSVSPLEL